MTSHGVARASRPRTEEQRLLDLEKIDRYRSLETEIRQKADQKSFGQDTFQLTSKLLRLNPEYYTVWNVRRRCIISGLFSGPSDGSSPSKESLNSSETATHITSSDASLPSSSVKTQPSPDSPTTGKNGTTAEQWAQDLEVIKSELTFTVPLLMEFPKCYWIWNYRLWVLDQAVERLPVPASRRVWEEELGLVSKMLNRDKRNFHAWGYRRFVVSKLESSTLNGSSMVEPEFDYTTKKIHEDLSNFSAWHNRSQLIPRLLNERQADDASRKQFLEKELAYIREGLNVGPEDQSLWFYHQYLVSNIMDEPTTDQTIAPNLSRGERKSYIENEIFDIKDLLEDYQDIKWMYEALIEYTVALCALENESAANHAEISSWVKTVKELDPQRTGRWVDLEKELGIE